MKRYYYYNFSVLNRDGKEVGYGTGVLSGWFLNPHTAYGYIKYELFAQMKRDRDVLLRVNKLERVE